MIDGAAPNTLVHIGATRLCGVCVTLIREQADGTWRHCALGFDHQPEPGTYPGISADVVRPWTCAGCRLVNWPRLDGSARDRCHGCDLPAGTWTESELRLAAGDR